MSSASATFHRLPASVAQVRRFVLASIHGASSSAKDAIVLMASELATNVVRHAGSDYRVEIRREPDAIEVRVTDGGGGRPTKRTPPPEEPTGRGILIVEALSDGWGTIVDEAESMTTVWFRVNLSSLAQR